MTALSLPTTGQPVDTETAREFMKETLNKVAREELEAIEAELREKSRRMRALLAPDNLPTLSDEHLTNLLRTVFATRRRAKDILQAVPPDDFRDAIARLLYGDTEVTIRFQQFVDTMTGYIGDVRVLRPRKSSDSRAKQSAEDAALHDNLFCDLGSELLHFTNPDEYWLWTRWIWDPQAGTGAMPLVTNDGVDLLGNTVGETYLKLGIATAFVKATGDAAGFFGGGPFGVDVFLVCVYAVYMYTTLRLRMTQEFNKVVPQLPELSRRLLGVWKMAI